VGWGLDWFVPGQALCCPVLNTELNFMIPLKAGNFLTSSGTKSFLRIPLLDGVVSAALFKTINGKHKFGYLCCNNRPLNCVSKVHSYE